MQHMFRVTHLKRFIEIVYYISLGTFLDRSKVLKKEEKERRDVSLVAYF